MTSPPGPKRHKRLYRVTYSGVSYAVRHFQDKRAAFEFADKKARLGYKVTIHESKPVEWQAVRLWTSERP